MAENSEIMNALQKDIFLIVYSCYDKAGNLIKSGKLKNKQPKTEIAAKVGTENYLAKKYNNFHRLVIHQCRSIDPFAEILKGFSGTKFGLWFSKP